MAPPVTNTNNTFFIHLFTNDASISNGISITPLETRLAYPHGLRFANTYDAGSPPAIPEPTYPITLSNVGITPSDTSFGPSINTSGITISTGSINATIISVPILSIGGIGFDGGTFGGIVNTQIFTANGTWTKPAGLIGNEQIIFQVWGAGGNGFATVDSWSDPDSGFVAYYSQLEAGGGGAYFSGQRLLSEIASSVAVTVGQSGGASSAFGGYIALGGANAGSSSPGGGAIGKLSPWGGGTGAEYYEPNSSGLPPTPRVSAGTSSQWGGAGGTCSGTSGGSSIFGHNLATGGSAVSDFGGIPIVSASLGAQGIVRVWVVR